MEQAGRVKSGRSGPGRGAPGRRGVRSGRRASPGGLEIVAKVGGSLYDSPSLREVVKALADAARSSRLLIVPGGGPFADTVRGAWRRHRLSDKGAHRMALLAMDQFGLLLCDLEPRAEPVRTLAAARRALVEGKLPVLLAARLAAAARDLPASWSVTSDSIAAWVAGRAGARRLVLIKSIDGPAPGKRALSAIRVAVRKPTCTADRMAERGWVDQAFPGILPRGIDCRIVNGRVPGRVAELLAAGSSRRSPRSSSSRNSLRLRPPP